MGAGAPPTPDAAPAAPLLDARDRRALAVQRAVGRALSPLWLPLCVLALRHGLGFRFARRGEVRAVRALYRRMRRESGAPIMICANHLTMIDSFLVAWALGGLGDHLRDHGGLPWNTPERANFTTSHAQRALVYVAKCLPVSRGGDRAEVARVLAKVSHLLARGDAVLMFPEGGRSRSGRVDVAAAAWGVGRVVRSLPGCRVLCVYLRGENQASWSALPVRGERFRVSARPLEPKAEGRGVRASRDVAQQIVVRLAEMERELEARRERERLDARQ